MARKRHDLREDDGFNTPAEMLARLAYLAWLASLPAGILLTLAGLLTARWPLALGGVAGLTLGWCVRDWLRRRERFEPAAAALDAVPEIGARAEETRLARLVVLLREWDALEQRRGTPGFDPWAVQAVRNDIHAVVENDPALISLFRTHRQAA
jgi:hypothetical protein